MRGDQWRIRGSKDGLNKENSTFSEQDDGVSIFESELVNLGFNVDSFNVGEGFQFFGFNFVVEVTNIANNGVVLHLGHVVGSDDTFVSSGSDEHVHLVKGIFNSHDFVTLHAGLKGADGVNFGNEDSGTCSFHGLSASFSDITETTDDDFLS